MDRGLQWTRRGLFATQRPIGADPVEQGQRVLRATVARDQRDGRRQPTDVDDCEKMGVIEPISSPVRGLF
ncbi:hypothetical protein EAH79_02225 [Sphingomonas koreensis]|nr:hypothetical protein EAH79_02225 [Sphingomonas koreensis]